MSAREQVFAVRRADFFAGDWPQGFLALADGTASTLLQEFAARGSFLDRQAAEADPAWKQLIPYCVLQRGEEIFTVQRKRGSTEARLHDLLSIGLGGHVNPEPGLPADGPGRFAAALRRELDEELDLRLATPRDPTFLGLLNDDSNAVGSVHAGLVYRLQLRPMAALRSPSESVAVREISKLAGGFRHLVELDNLWQDPNRFESWSRILFASGIARSKATSDKIPDDEARSEHGCEEPNHG